jgi:hypothetical protein
MSEPEPPATVEPTKPSNDLDTGGIRTTRIVAKAPPPPQDRSEEPAEEPERLETAGGQEEGPEPIETHGESRTETRDDDKNYHFLSPVTRHFFF